MTLRDETPDFYKFRDMRPNERWHVIYRTGTGQDYCRETLAARCYGDAASEARDLFDQTADATARRAVDAFRIECW